MTFALTIGSSQAQCAGSFAQQSPNTEITLADGQQFLLGKINIDGLKTVPYHIWYSKSYDNYLVDTSLVNLFAEELKTKKIKLFMGTWCGDSKREVPRFLKILELANYPIENLELIALDRRKGRVKTSPTGEEKGLNIIKVPTFIFFEDGKEVNRIVESPIASLEEDIYTILNKLSYRPNYSR